MQLKRIFIFLFYLIFATNLYSQGNSSITKGDYEFLIDSLSSEKYFLIKSKENIEITIDSLKKQLVLLEKDFQSCRSNNLLKKYGKELANRIINGQVWKGMTEKMLRDSWGKPDRIDTNKEKWGVFSQWYYGDITYFFRDGSMIDWEEKK